MSNPAAAAYARVATTTASARDIEATHGHVELRRQSPVPPDETGELAGASPHQKSSRIAVQQSYHAGCNLVVEPSDR